MNSSLARIVLPGAAVVVAGLLTGPVLAAEKLKPKEHNARRDAFFAEVKTVALVPLRGAQVKGRDDVPVFIEEMLADKLSRYEIETIPDEIYETLWNEKMYDLGGIYDPITGKKLEDNVEQIRRHAREGVEAQHDIDAYLIPTLSLKEVGYAADVATWDGVREKIYVPKGRGLLSGTAADAGIMSGLSLNLRFERPDGSVIYAADGGWQLVEKFTKSGREQILPPDLFNDEFRNRMAVHLALRPLLLDYSTFVGDRSARNREKPRE